MSVYYFFLNDTAPTEIYTLSLHDALPICRRVGLSSGEVSRKVERGRVMGGYSGWVRGYLIDEYCDYWYGEDCTALTDRKSTRLNSSHGYISYAVFCLKKKTTTPRPSIYAF